MNQRRETVSNSTATCAGQKAFEKILNGCPALPLAKLQFRILDRVWQFVSRRWMPALRALLRKFPAASCTTWQTAAPPASRWNPNNRVTHPVTHPVFTGCVTLLFGFQRLAGGAAVCH